VTPDNWREEIIKLIELVNLTFSTKLFAVTKRET
jgi:hypothetical protein